jgi:hypothetical protein
VEKKSKKNKTLLSLAFLITIMAAVVSLVIIDRFTKPIPIPNTEEHQPKAGVAPDCKNCHGTDERPFGKSHPKRADCMACHIYYAPIN